MISKDLLFWSAVCRLRWLIDWLIDFIIHWFMVSSFDWLIDCFELFFVYGGLASFIVFDLSLLQILRDPDSALSSSLSAYLWAHLEGASRPWGQSDGGAVPGGRSGGSDPQRGHRLSRALAPRIPPEAQGIPAAAEEQQGASSRSARQAHSRHDLGGQDLWVDLTKRHQNITFEDSTESNFSQKKKKKFYDNFCRFFFTFYVPSTFSLEKEMDQDHNDKKRDILFRIFSFDFTLSL